MSERFLDRIRSSSVLELAELMRLDNNVEHLEAVVANAHALRSMFEKRGFSVQLLETPTGRPAVFAQLDADRGVDRSLLVYSHYDGVPPGEGWSSDPYVPILRAAPGPDDTLGSPVPWPEDGAFCPDWRLVGRSGADSKASIVALLAAVDLLLERGETPSVHLKVLLDGEEERESPSLPDLIRRNAELLAADALIYSCGEAHPSGLPTVTLGARGILLLELTTWTAAASAHSGHFGGFVPNAALALARLLASLKGFRGEVSVAGFEDGILPLEADERAALDSMPNQDRRLMESFSLHCPEVASAPWHHLLCRPNLNIRGMTSGAVGRQAANVIPHRATAEIDVRLVAGMDPDLVQQRIEEHLRRQGAEVFAREPTSGEIRGTPSAVTLRRLAGFPAFRTCASHPVVARIVAAVRWATSEQVVVEPTEGGSLPLHLFQALTPVILGLPTANYDNRQHAADENLHLRFLFRGIEIWASVLRWDTQAAVCDPSATRVGEVSRRGRRLRAAAHSPTRRGRG